MTKRRQYVWMCVVAALVVLLLATSGSRPTAAQSSRTDAEGVPSFIEVNKRYAVRWQPGDVETYRVLEIKDGWVRGESQTKDAPTRMVLWLNPRQAITIQEVP